MLLEFELQNDAVFAEASAISLIAGALKERSRNNVVDVGDAAATKALTSCLILGKNGSGKSTLVEAMRFVSSFVGSSANESGKDAKIAYEPNLLCPGLDSLPTRYRVAFSVRGVVYDFEFAHTRKRVTYESLQIADRSVRFRKMYERRWLEGPDEYEYSFGEALTGRKSVWQDSTRENALFISTAVQLNSEDLASAYDWLANYVQTTHISGQSTDRDTSKRCLIDSRFKDRVVNFLQAMDINVEDILTEEEPADEKAMAAMFSSEFIEGIQKVLGRNPLLEGTYKTNFVKRKFDGQMISFPLRKESTGTIALFNLAGPLFEALDNGYCLLIDEINTSLHPIIVSFLVDMFANERVNCKRAQLLFTSHDTSVLAKHKMRRDQIWLIENGERGAHLVPLSDFSPRRDEALDKGYLGGRYGGVPIVSPGLLFGSHCED